MSVRTDILNEAAKLTSDDRMKEYGPPEENFADVAAGWNILLAGKLTGLIAPHEVAACMAWLKLCRSKRSADKRDTWVDLCGYGAIAGQLAVKAEPELPGMDEKRRLTECNGVPVHVGRMAQGRWGALATLKDGTELVQVGDTENDALEAMYVSIRSHERKKAEEAGAVKKRHTIQIGVEGVDAAGEPREHWASFFVDGVGKCVGTGRTHEEAVADLTRAVAAYGVEL